MAKEQIILEYQLVQKGGEKVVSTVTDITEAWDKSGKAATAALSEKQIDAATAKLEKFNVEVEKTATQFTSAKAELGALTKQITSGALQGKDLQVAVKRAAELKDRIGDVRDEIGRLSSDTRIFDTFVEGGRAVAAAFSVAQGAAALFGSENKDLQKAILKTQGALALLTGAQELANIVTKQGGIATQAYGVALKVVEGIQKAFAISAAASWAVATAGLTLLVAGVASLVYWYNQADEETKEVTESTNEFADSLKGSTREAANLRIELEKSRGGVTDISAQLQKNNLARIAAIEDANLKEKEAVDKLNEEISKADGESLSKLLEQRNTIREQAEANRKAINQKFFLQDELAVQESENKKAEIERKAAEDRFKQRQQNNKEIQNLEKFTLPEKKVDFVVDELKITPQEVTIEKVPEVKVPVTLTPKSPEEVFTEFIDNAVEYLNQAQPLVSALTSLSSSFFQIETSNLQKEKEKQLAIVGDNTKKREAIEKQFAVKSAQLKRKQAIADKVFSIFQIGIATAQAIQKQLAATPLPAGAAFIALIAASAAAQVAAVAAQPLPEIPKFAKGGKINGNPHSMGGVIIEAEGGEFINNTKSTQKYSEELQAANNLELEDLIYHKYLLPALKQAGAADKDGNLYDDWMLRKEVRASRQADKDNSKYIASSIVSAIKENNYNARKHYINN